MILGSFPLMYQLAFLDVAETGTGARSVRSVLTDAWDKMGERVGIRESLGDHHHCSSTCLQFDFLAPRDSKHSKPKLDMKHATCNMKQHETRYMKYSNTRKELLHTLTGTAVCWFLFDIVFYGNALFTTAAVDLLGVGEGQAAVSHVISVSLVALMVRFSSNDRMKKERGVLEM